MITCKIQKLKLLLVYLQSDRTGLPDQTPNPPKSCP